MRLSEVLREKPARVVSLPPTASVVQAAVLMKLEGVGAILVCDSARRIQGVLSDAHYEAAKRRLLEQKPP